MKIAGSRPRLLLALVAALLLVGCGSQDSQFRIVLPRIIVDIDQDGNPSVAGISPIALSVFGIDPNQFRLPKDTVDQLVDSNLQHAELLFRNDGLYWWANGKPLVPLTWDDQSFGTTTDLLNKFVKLDPTASGLMNNVLLPGARASEQNIVIRFPLKAGESAIPIREMGGPVPEPGQPVDPGAVVRLHLSFNEQGEPSFRDVPIKELGTLFGADLSAASLPPDVVKQLTDAGIQHITIRTTPEGIKLWSNDQPLPTLRWGEDTLNSTAETVASLKLIDPAIAAVVKQFVPYLNTVDANLVLRFPTTAAPIPLP
jgi:hypothetical protein